MKNKISEKERKGREGGLGHVLCESGVIVWFQLVEQNVHLRCWKECDIIEGKKWKIAGITNIWWFNKNNLERKQVKDNTIILLT